MGRIGGNTSGFLARAGFLGSAVLCALVFAGLSARAVSAASLVASAPASSAATSPATATASALADEGGLAYTGAKGKWRALCPYAPALRALSPNYIWLDSSGYLAQVNSSTGEVRLFTTLDGLPVGRLIHEIATGQDDRAIVLIQRTPTPFLWTPKQGWSALPAIPDKNEIFAACFDLDGTILAVPRSQINTAIGTELYEFVKGTWRVRRTIPACEQVIPVKDGLILRLAKTKSTDETCDVVLLKNSDQAATKLVTLGTAQANWPQRTVWLDGKLFEYRPPNWSHEQKLPAVRELTADGYKTIIEKNPIALDLGAQEFLARQNGQAPADWVRAGSTALPIRTKDGSYWQGLTRWKDGKKTNLGPRVTQCWFHLWADSSFCELDPIDGFRPLRPAAAAGLTIYDPTTGRGFLSANIRTAAGGMEPVIRCVELDKNGVSKTLFEVPERQLTFKAVPKLMTPDGDWWGSGEYDGRQVFRITRDGKGQKYSLENHCDRLTVGPKGTLMAAPQSAWLPGDREMSDKESLYRFDAGKNAFVPAPDGWDELAFKIGPYELAAFCFKNNYGVSSAKVMQKVDGKWQLCHVPFSPGKVAMAAGSVSGQRVLFTVEGVGIVEYDANRNRWARLEDDGDLYCHYGVFDGRGRRLLMSCYHALVYDGDPFEAQGWQAQKISPEDEKLFGSLLKQLDADAYRVRVKATEDLQQLAAKVLPLLDKAASDDKLPLETQARVKDVLDKIPQEMRQNILMPSLLRHDCPLVTPPAK